MARESHAANRKGSKAQKERLERTSAGGDYDQEERMLMAAAVVVSRARKAVSDRLGFSCSGGVAPTKQLAKLGCGLHKPNQQTVVLPRHIDGLLQGHLTIIARHVWFGVTWRREGVSMSDTVVREVLRQYSARRFFWQQR